MVLVEKWECVVVYLFFILLVRWVSWFSSLGFLLCWVLWMVCVSVVSFCLV